MIHRTRERLAVGFVLGYHGRRLLRLYGRPHPEQDEPVERGRFDLIFVRLQAMAWNITARAREAGPKSHNPLD